MQTASGQMTVSYSNAITRSYNDNSDNIIMQRLYFPDKKYDTGIYSVLTSRNYGQHSYIKVNGEVYYMCFAGNNAYYAYAVDVSTDD